MRVEPGTKSGLRRVWFVTIGVGTVAILAMALLLFRGVRGVYGPPVDELPERADAVVVFSGEIARTRLALQLMDDGISDVLVLSLGNLDPTGKSLCGQSEPFEILCPTPRTVNTRGEARMFGDIARENKWTSLVAVTGDYHAQRARLRLSRCYDGDVAFANVDWGRPRGELVRRETLGYLEAQLLQRGC